MSTSHVAWASIELLHNVVRTLRHLEAQGQPLPTVRYRAKVKLHGTNCAVQVTPAGVFAQSRTTMLAADADYKGFATWVKRHEPYFAALAPCVVFGEWCGPGVEKGMAISQVATKLFTVFGIAVGDHVIAEPAELRARLPIANAPPELHVLPWDGDEITIDFANAAQLDAAVLQLNARVDQIEREDPWVKATFGITGVGEGLVFYPLGVPDPIAPLMFKAKGEKHRTVGAKVAVQVDATAAASVDAFVALVVTDARLHQALATVCDGARDPKRTGAFISWIADDVQKECAAELEAASLTFADVDKAVRVRARAWFLAK